MKSKTIALVIPQCHIQKHICKFVDKSDCDFATAAPQRYPRGFANLKLLLFSIQLNAVNRLLNLILRVKQNVIQFVLP